MSDKHHEQSDPHIPSDWFDCIQLTIRPNDVTASIEYTTKDGPSGCRKTIPLMPPSTRQTDFDRRMAPVLEHFRKLVQEQIECDRNTPSTTE